jgi:cellulose synthase/poly-beta-1,6-N-acetylglucosamine synthase-like glycosyltransferase
MKKLLTLTIGIPAYNEEQNMQPLLLSLLRQEEKRYKLEKIIVYSDGSSDQTAQIAKDFNSNRIEVVAASERQGLAAGLNYLVQASRSDILVILNADISIPDTFFLEKLIKPFHSKKAELVSAKMVELPAVNFFSSVLNASMQFKTQLYEHLHNKNNVYLCHGQVRAFAKEFYKTLHFPYSISEDAYSYFMCKKQKYTFYYNSESIAYYKVPSNFIEHKNQSTRFFKTISILKADFDENYLQKQYKLPVGLFVKEFTIFCISKPIECIFYLRARN